MQEPLGDKMKLKKDLKKKKVNSPGCCNNSTFLGT